MVSPNEIAHKAAQKEENYAFRTYLKIHADSKKLDAQFRKLHQELFSKYDCGKCRNCCKQFRGAVPAEDIERDATYLDLSSEEFIEQYLEYNDVENIYQTKNIPCDFLDEKGNCRLHDCKPKQCSQYPYTDQPDRIGSLLNIVQTAEICPVVYEMLERLKEEYHFDNAKKEEYCDDWDYFTAGFDKKVEMQCVSKQMPIERTGKKVYPNEPCPCGSGKKFKKCCGKKQ